MDRIEAMSLLLETIGKGSLSAASRSLGVPVATLSRKISDLETLLGTQLLIRTTRKLTLTDAGVGYVAAARRIVEQVEEAEREATGEFTAPKGELVVSAPVLFGRLHVLPVVVDFLALYPEINVRLVLSDRNVHLIDDHVDIAVRIGRLADSTMVATRIGSMRTVVCARPALLVAHGAPQTPHDLQKLPWVTIDTPMPFTAWRFEPSDQGAGVETTVVPRLSVTTAETAAQAAIRGVGVTRLLLYQVADAVANGALEIILDAHEPELVPIHLIHVVRSQMPLKLRRFLDFAAQSLRKAIRVKLVITSTAARSSRVRARAKWRAARSAGSSWR